MDDAEFQHLVRIAWKERAKAISDAEARFRERIASLQKTRELAALAEAQSGNGAVSLPYGEVASRVKRLLPTMPDTFTLADMARAIRQQDAFGAGAHNKAISVALRRLINDQIELVEKGQGKRGSTYRKLKTNSMTLVG